MNPRMNPPRGQPMGPMNPGYGGMRPPPNANMGLGGPGMPPMSMPGGRPWQPNPPPNMNFSSTSPGSHFGVSSFYPNETIKQTLYQRVLPVMAPETVHLDQEHLSCPVHKVQPVRTLLPVIGWVHLILGGIPLVQREMGCILWWSQALICRG